MGYLSEPLQIKLEVFFCLLELFSHSDVSKRLYPSGNIGVLWLYQGRRIAGIFPLKFVIHV